MGGSYFFTVVLRNRKSTLLIDYVDLLRCGAKDILLSNRGSFARAYACWMDITTRGCYLFPPLVIAEKSLHLFLWVPKRELGF